MLCNLSVEIRLTPIARRYEISRYMLSRLAQLRQYEIVIVCDDSGSMNTPLSYTQQTRWNRLCDIIKIVLEIAIIFDSNGVDIYFLNHPPIHNVKQLSTIEHIFSREPCGYTPLVPILRHIFQLPPSRCGHDKQLLVLVATDGAPTDANDMENISELESVLRNDRKIETTFVNFLICTDDPECIRHLRRWDQSMDNVDVIDEFSAERARIRRRYGNSFPFSFGDHISRALLGAIDPLIDEMNDLVENDDIQA